MDTEKRLASDRYYSVNSGEVNVSRNAMKRNETAQVLSNGVIEFPRHNFQKKKKKILER